MTLEVYLLQIWFRLKAKSRGTHTQVRCMLNIFLLLCPHMSSILVNHLVFDYHLSLTLLSTSKVDLQNFWPLLSMFMETWQNTALLKCIFFSTIGHFYDYSMMTELDAAPFLLLLLMGSAKSCDINKLSWGGVRSTFSQVKSLSTLYTFHLF